MGGPPKQTIPLSVLARNQTKDSWTWNLAVSGSGKGTRMRVGWTKELAGSWRWDPDESSWWLDSKESWRGTTERGSQHRTPETVAEKRGSSHSEEDRLKLSAFELLVEFSLVTHASDSPHMHVVLQYLLLLLVNPKLCSCLFVCFIFSYPPDRILVVPRNVRYPPRTTSWSPASREGMVRRKLTCVGARGRNVTAELTSAWWIKWKQLALKPLLSPAI